MTAKKSLDSMTVEELEQESYRLDEEQQKVREQRVEVQQAISRALAREKLANMPDSEREELLQLVETAGIKSSEKVGGKRGS